MDGFNGVHFEIGQPANAVGTRLGSFMATLRAYSPIMELSRFLRRIGVAIAAVTVAFLPAVASASTLGGAAAIFVNPAMLMILGLLVVGAVGIGALALSSNKTAKRFL